MSTRIALATCGKQFVGEADDRPLLAALDARAIAYERPRWDDLSVDWARYGAVVLRSVWDYHDQPAAFAAWIDAVAAQTRLFNPAPIVHWNGRKDYLRELAQHGVEIAPTRWLACGERHDLRAHCLALGIDALAFLKPVIGANAKHTLRFDAGDS